MAPELSKFGDHIKITTGKEATYYVFTPDLSVTPLDKEGLQREIDSAAQALGSTPDQVRERLAAGEPVKW